MSLENHGIEIEDELERFMQLHKLKNIKDVLKIAPAELLKMDGFGYRLLNYCFNKQENKESNTLSND